MKTSLFLSTRIALVALFVSGSTFAVTSDVMVRGWKPPMEFFGAGNADLTVKRLRDMNDLQRVTINNYQYHPETQEFVDYMWKSLKGFNLKGFHKKLPNEESDGWRSLSVYGRREGEAYIVGPFPAAGAPVIEALGDVLVQVKSKKTNSEFGNSYLIDGNVKIGFNAFSWDSVLAAGEEAVRLTAEGDPTFAKDTKVSWAKNNRKKIKAMNSSLGEEDVQILAPFDASFPESWKLLTKLGRVENVVDTVVSGKYQHLKSSFAFDPDVMEDHYPELADHLDSLNDLIKGRVEISNDNGRLVLIDVDTDSLTVTIEAYVTEGRFLAFKDGKVLTNVKPVHLGEGSHFDVTANATFELFGVFANVDNMNAEINYTPNDKGAVVVTSMTEIPDVSLGGRVFGILPMSFVTAIMPFDIIELIERFIGVAVKGNDGKGILAEIEFIQVTEGDLAKADINVSMEALNNFLIRIGMSIVNKRVLPNKEESADIDRLIQDTLKAFVADLDHFEKVVVNYQAGVDPELP